MKYMNPLTSLLTNLHLWLHEAIGTIGVRQATEIMAEGGDRFGDLFVYSGERLTVIPMRHSVIIPGLRHWELAV